MAPLFKPSLSCQRYKYVEKYLMERPDIKSVTDVGCGNGRMVNWIKSVSTVELVNCLDANGVLLDYEIDRFLRPSLIEAVFGRKCSDKEIAIKVYHGDIAVPDERIKADCFTLVEMIEHITLEEVANISRSIFDFYQPKHVIVTTPNAEFNHLLDQHGSEEHRNKPKDPNNKFRHFDHKFEWTRAEFDQWAKYICATYNYEYSMDGVGHLEGSQPYGPCTQIAIFTRKQDQYMPAGQRDLACFDLLLNTLTVDEPQGYGIPSKQRMALLGEFVVPGFNNPMPESPPWDAEIQGPPVRDRLTQERDEYYECDRDCDIEYCECKGNLDQMPKHPEVIWEVRQPVNDAAMEVVDIPHEIDDLEVW